MSLADPFMFDPGRFWADEDVQLLDWADIGVYMRLLSHQWTEGDIPNDERRLRAVLAGGLRGVVSDEQMDVVLVFFPVVVNDPMRRRHAKLHQEREEWIEKRDSYRESKAAAGRASGEARRAKAEHRAGGNEQVLSTRSTGAQQGANGELTGSERNRTKSNSVSPSESLSPSESGSSKNPPKPPKGGKGATAKGKPSKRRIPPITFPPAYLRAGLTADDFAKRVRTCNVTKKPETWQGEIDAVGERVEKHGAEAVAELYRRQFETGYHGIPWTQIEDNGRGFSSGVRPTPAAGGRRPDGDQEFNF